MTKKLIKRIAPVSRQEALDSVRNLLEYIGEDPYREGLLQTPLRVVESFKELYGGYGQSPKEILSKTYRAENSDMVVLGHVDFNSICEHHMLPFQGKCHIGYIPGDRITGFGSLVSLIELYARRLQIQETLTSQIVQALTEHLKPLGAGVMIEASHTCMSCQGAKKKGAVVSTSSLRGCFRSDEAIKREFFGHCRSKPFS